MSGRSLAPRSRAARNHGSSRRRRRRSAGRAARPAPRVPRALAQKPPGSGRPWLRAGGHRRERWVLPEERDPAAPEARRREGRRPRAAELEAAPGGKLGGMEAERAARPRVPAQSPRAAGPRTPAESLQARAPWTRAGSRQARAPTTGVPDSEGGQRTAKPEQRTAESDLHQDPSRLAAESERWAAESERWAQAWTAPAVALEQEPRVGRSTMHAPR